MDKGQIRREMKRRGRQSLRTHYGVLTFICLLAAVLGAEFRGSLAFLSFGQSHIDEISTFLNGFGRAGFDPSSRGVLAMAVQRIREGSVGSIIDSTIRSMAGSNELLLTLGILINGAIYIFLTIYLVNTFCVAMRRVFLESRTYRVAGLHRLTFLYQVRRWGHTALAILRKDVQQLLWTLTVVGGVIKHYSYAMVPFLLAENPALTGKQAILLSRRMMDGHKWETFVLDLTLLPWTVLAVLTLGVSDVFFGSAYRTAIYSEWYARLREEALRSGMEGAAEAFTDAPLFTPCDAETLRKAYPAATPPEPMPERRYANPVARFFGEALGVTLGASEQELAIERTQANELRARHMTQCAAGEAYPMRLSLLTVRERQRRREPLIYARRYSLCSIIMIFFVFSIIGWLWEVGLHLVSDGVFVNRGVLHGPWLPIYGSGVALILMALYRARKKPALEFVLTIVLCGIVEYCTALVLETTHGGQRWWEYGGYFLNLHGRICAEGLLVFGLGGLAAVYVAAPLLDNLLRRMNRRVLAAVCVVLVLLFGADQMYSKAHPNAGEGITSSEPQMTEEPEAGV